MCLPHGKSVGCKARPPSTGHARKAAERAAGFLRRSGDVHSPLDLKRFDQVWFHGLWLPAGEYSVVMSPWARWSENRCTTCGEVGQRSARNRC